MTFTVIWLPEATDAYREIRALDPVGAARIAAAVRSMADDPHPLGARRLGGTDLYRLHLDDHRVLYQVDESACALTVILVGRT